ncbi:hypothetical protein ACFVKB_21490 [Rhodococcus sp. NPDC127530]|uniref:hypothetical protein n=1 Tax=unclassified Rhodococcus (in: high G+C Gram-positive bacteria) TaxID=192944 RepID=UPI003640E56F
MSLPPAAAEQAAGTGRLVVSPERLDALNSDLVIILVNGGAARDLESLPGFADLPSVREGGMFIADYPTVTGVNLPRPAIGHARIRSDAALPARHRLVMARRDAPNWCAVPTAPSGEKGGSLMRLDLASGVGILRLAVDAGIALTSMVIAVPVAFVIGEAAVIGRAMRAYEDEDEDEYGYLDEHERCTVSPDSSTHDLGTVIALG